MYGERPVAVIGRRCAKFKTAVLQHIESHALRKKNKEIVCIQGYAELSHESHR